MHLYVRVHMQVRAHVHVRVHVRVCARARARVRVHVRVCVCVHVRANFLKAIVCPHLSLRAIQRVAIADVPEFLFFHSWLISHSHSVSQQITSIFEGLLPSPKGQTRRDTAQKRWMRFVERLSASG